MSSEVSMDRRMGGIIHKVCRDFRRNEIEPVALELDTHFDAQRVKSIWRKGFDLDLPSLLVPEEYGGVGQSLLTAAQVLDEMAGACAGVATIFAVHLAACLPVIEAGESRRELLAALAGEEGREPPMLALALPEEDDAVDLPRLREKNGDLTLHGVARLVACAPLADRLVVCAGDAGGSTLVTVDAGAAGVSIGEAEELLGLHTVPFSDVVFEGCRLADHDLLGERGAAGPVVEKTIDALHGFLAAVAVGTARSAHDAALRYAQERFQFGKMIIEHHEIRRMLSNMVAKIDVGTAGYERALTEEGRGDSDACRACARAKIFCTDAALEIVLDAIQIHGGYGYMKETGLEKMMRDVKMLQLLGGSNRRLEVG